VNDQLIDRTLALITRRRRETERAYLRDRVASFQKFQAEKQCEREAFADRRLADIRNPNDETLRNLS
jgi:hypothetical protein